MKQKIVFWLLVIAFFAVMFMLPGCIEVKTGKFVSTEKPIIVLGKSIYHGRYSTIRYFHVYVNEFIKVSVTEQMYNDTKVGDTIKNVAIVIN